jgi:hypothetical protein
MKKAPPKKKKAPPKGKKEMPPGMAAIGDRMLGKC